MSDRAEISIRRAEPGDYEALHRIFTSPKLVRGTLQLPFPSLETWRKRLAEPAEGIFSLVACAGGEVVGEITLHTSPTRWRRRHAGEIGMAVRDDWQGRGVGTALMLAVIDLAENWLNLTRLELIVYADNEPAIGLYKKCGFVVEGTMKDWSFRDGEYADCLSMARLTGVHAIPDRSTRGARYPNLPMQEEADSA